MRTLPLGILVVIAATLPAQTPWFVNFESPQTHPIAVSADGTRLFAVNTPDNRLAVYSLRNPDRPVLEQEIPVGLEPVSVTPRTADEVWVTNRLSDSVSVVSLAQGVVTATIAVKDEPADTVFAGSPQVALVSVSGSREVRVFDTAPPYALLATVPIFGDEPRALARSQDGSKVWVAVHRSGNNTTIVPESKAPPPPPPTNTALPAAPSQGILVDADDAQWKNAHGVTLADHDVVEIDVATRAVTRPYRGVGTSLYGIAVHPTSGDLWVANTEARNLVRFSPNLRGHLVDNRVTRIVPGSQPQATAFDLNPGVNYGVLPNLAAKATALAQATDLVWSRDGAELYVAAFGTDRIGVLDAQGSITARVELGTPGSGAAPSSKRGPRGLALHPSAARLYVLNRISMTLAVVDTAAKQLLREMPLGYDPTPAHISDGRGFLYDAKLAGNGTASCAACHLDGEIDGVAWDLGDPGGNMLQVTTGVVFTVTEHPMKGPMTTQTLRGLTPNTAPFHWRGDKPQLQDFNSAFDDTMGGSKLSTGDMDAFAAFLETLAFPPNPNQNLDRTYPTTPVGTSAEEGRQFYLNTAFATAPIFGALTCNLCHTLPTGTNQLVIPDFILQEPQPFKVPHLRNVYKRDGRRPVNGVSRAGFGILHDGSENDVFDLLSRPVFMGLSNQTQNKRKLQSFVMAFDTGMAPAVGHSVTVTAQNRGSTAVRDALDLLEGQVTQGNIDLVAKGVFRGAPHGFVRIGGGYRADAASLGSFTRTQLLNEIGGNGAQLTFLGVPPGTGTRIGIDRDRDGTLDGDEAAQPYGSATPACAPPLALDANGSPSVGNSLFALRVQGAGPGAPGVVLLGAQQASLPFADLLLLVSPVGAATLPLTADGTGTALGELPVPTNSGLLGATVFAQAAFANPCGQLGLAASNGLAMTVTP